MNQLKYLLSTKACIDLITNQSQSLLERLEMVSLGEVGVSSITVMRLIGALRQPQSGADGEALHNFFLNFEIVPFTGQDAWQMAKLSKRLSFYSEEAIIAQSLTRQLTLICPEWDERTIATGARIAVWR